VARFERQERHRKSGQATAIALDHFIRREDLIALVANDLDRGAVKPTGRQGLPAEAVLRCALIKQYRQLSYDELAFLVEDSASLRAFARLPFGSNPKRSVLHKTIGAIRAET
jgi:IS5 family transposase